MQWNTNWFPKHILGIYIYILNRPRVAGALLLTVLSINNTKSLIKSLMLLLHILNIPHITVWTRKMKMVLKFKFLINLNYFWISSLPLTLIQCKKKGVGKGGISKRDVDFRVAFICCSHCFSCWSRKHRTTMTLFCLLIKAIVHISKYIKANSHKYV